RSDLSLAVIGAGVMGRGIAQVAAQAGVRVLVFDSRPGAAREAKDSVAAQWQRMREKRSEEHTSELQSLTNLVCRLLLENKKIAYAGYCLTKDQPKYLREVTRNPH